MPQTMPLRATQITPNEFLRYPYLLSDGKAELVRGNLYVFPPPGGPHGRTATNLVVLLSNYVEPRALGWVFADNVGYQLLGLHSTVRVPDLSFVRAGRLPDDGVEEGLFKFAPDLAVEVLSPSERKKKIEEKLDDYRVSGTAMVCVVDPRRRTVMIVPSNGPRRLLNETDTFDGGDVIPGFICPVTDVFRGVARRRRS